MIHTIYDAISPAGILQPIAALLLIGVILVLFVAAIIYICYLFVKRVRTKSKDDPTNDLGKQLDHKK